MMSAVSTEKQRSQQTSADTGCAPNPILGRLFKEFGAGGFSRVGGTVEFYLRLAALTPEGGSVLDLGAGRGRLHENPAADVLLRIIDLPRHASRLVGADVDSAVLENRYVKEKLVFDPKSPLPFKDNEFDLVYADWVLEHVDNPEAFASEVLRIIKPGGWFCARTPNKWGITGVGARLFSTKKKKAFIQGLGGPRGSDDVFETVYKLNTLREIDRYFPRRQWRDFSYIMNSEPPYVQGALAVRAVLVFWRLAPENLFTNIYCFKQKS